MRTLTLQQWAIKNWVCSFLNGERRYSVSGALVFEMPFSSVGPDVDDLRQAIYDVDRLFPWHDDIHPDAGGFKSIFYLGEGKVSVHCFRTIIWFGLRPMWDNLRKGQVYAYEKYLAKLAEELAKLYRHTCSEVRSVIEIRAVTSFRPDSSV